MRKSLLFAAVVLTSFAAVANGQTPPPSQPPPVRPVQTPPAGVAMPVVAPLGQQTPPPSQGTRPAQRPAGTWQNVKLEVKITDSLNVDVQSTKTISMLIVDGRNGQVRSMSGDGLINIDARPSVGNDGRVLLDLTVEYRPELTAQQVQQSGTSRVAGFTESLSLMLVDGKPTTASQSADPRSDRKVSIEVTATVMK